MRSFKYDVTVPIEAFYEHEKGDRGSRDSPGTPASLDITTIEFNGAEITGKLLWYLLREYADEFEAQAREDFNERS